MMGLFLKEYFFLLGFVMLIALGGCSGVKKDYSKEKRFVSQVRSLIGSQVFEHGKITSSKIILKDSTFNIIEEIEFDMPIELNIGLLLGKNFYRKNESIFFPFNSLTDETDGLVYLTGNWMNVGGLRELRRLDAHWFYYRK